MGRYCGPWRVSTAGQALASFHLVLSGACHLHIDGQPPLADHGSDTDDQGAGIVDRQRLYQLVRQTSNARDRLFEIEFLDPGVQANVFTFG